jgi:hypothetical protein
VYAPARPAYPDAVTQDRVPDGWLRAASDPPPDRLEAVLGELVARLTEAAAAAAHRTGRDPLGIRAVELPAGVRAYVCAFDGPSFLCLDDAMRPVDDPRLVRRAAAAGLLWEQLEALVDPGRLGDLVAAAGRLLAVLDEPAAVTHAVATVAEEAGRLAGWRASPMRTIASLPQMDVAATLQGRAYVAYGAFVSASEPLVGRQDTLPAEQVDALRAFEQAAAAAGVGERLADVVATLMRTCDEAAGEIVEGHLAALRGGGTA